MYPTRIEVEKANRIQLARWYRFLPSPGKKAIKPGYSYKEFERELRKEKEILDRVIVRFTEMGGFSPDISKHVGWEA